VVIPAQAGFIAVAATESQVAAPPAAASTPEVAATYRTRIPKSFSYRYDMRRGAIAGLGELTWRPSGDSYEAQLKGSVGGLAILGWTSTGSFDAHGLSPVRYVDHRIGKSDQAANFQRSEDKITFSGSSHEFKVQAGAQDRLSWMIQLPAILAADPSKAKAGTRLSVYVVGAHGDAEVWVFESSGSEQVTTPAGSFQANKWSRQPRQPHDTMVEVWLDPAHQYLPVKARLSAPPSDSALELELADAGS
jgi:hypothetical protein